jgi:excinuclease ABC subunit A
LLNDEGRITTGEVLVTFDIPLSEKLSVEESLALISKQGYQRLLLEGKIARLDEALAQSRQSSLDFFRHVTIVQDRVKLTSANRARFVEACEQAYHFGKGKLKVHTLESTPAGRPIAIHHSTSFSNRLHCAKCDIEYREPSPALFSFNHPVGACPTCKGFGRVITIDYDLAIPDRSLTLAQGAVKPWRTGTGAESQADLAKFCKIRRVPMNVPFTELSHAQQRWVIEGDEDYGIDDDHRWPRLWYGVKGYFRWLETKSYKMHVRVLLSRYRAYTKCPECDGQRFNKDAQLYLFTDESNNWRLTLADFYALPVRDALALIDAVVDTRNAGLAARNRKDPITHALAEVRARLGYLDEVGLGYLTLDRPTRTLSGGETERVNLTTCLGTCLVNTLFVLDEPSVGLHPRDTERLVRILEKLRDTGNTVIVVEHEASVMRAADQIVDIGPGHGATGGEIVFQGPLSHLLKSNRSLTGQYLGGKKRIELPERRRVSDATRKLRISKATRHNLKNLSVEIPLNRFVVITGVSGSGKSTLMREIVFPALAEKLKTQVDTAKASDRLDTESKSEQEDPATPASISALISGYESLGQVVLVDQSPLGKTPRSNPAVYIGAFDDVREVFAQSEEAKQRGLNASAFSFNSGTGQCERCRGAGFEKIEMQFLSDVFIRCPECSGRRYRQHILEVKCGVSVLWSIADVLEATVDEAIEFLHGFPNLKPAVRAIVNLKLLQEVGLGYLRLGQPINTLSGGESQRLKLVRHLANAAIESKSKTPDARSTLFLFDEPTTGLHFDDVRVLLQVFQRLVEAGHSVGVIEHNLDVIKSADWVIDLGPEAGEGGGQIVAEGTPEEIPLCEASHTGRALRNVFGTHSSRPRRALLPVSEAA